MTINSGGAEGSGLGNAGGSSHYLGWKDKKNRKKKKNIAAGNSRGRPQRGGWAATTAQ